MRELLPAYRCISHVSLGDGEHISFWHDKWLGGQALAEAFPALHSHFTQGDASVREVLDHGIDAMLQSRLTRQATKEREKLHLLLADVEMESTLDIRPCAFAKDEGKLAAGMIYKASVRGDHKLPSFDFVRCNFAPRE